MPLWFNCSSSVVCEIKYDSLSPAHLHQLLHDSVPGKNLYVSIMIHIGLCLICLTLIKPSSFPFTFIIGTNYMLDTGLPRGFPSLLVMLITIYFPLLYLVSSPWPTCVSIPYPFLYHVNTFIGTHAIPMSYPLVQAPAPSV